MAGDTLMEKELRDDEKVLNLSGTNLRADREVNDYDLFNKILGLTPDYVWADCGDAMAYIRTMYNIMFPMIKFQRKVILDQASALEEAKALEKSKLKKEIRNLKDEIELMRMEEKDLLHTNVLMIEKLKKNGLYDGEATQFLKRE